MVEFSKREEVADWLESKPSEVAIVIAARSALRVVPALSVVFDRHRGLDVRDAARDIVLPALRAAAAAWVAAKYSSYRAVGTTAYATHVVANVAAAKAAHCAAGTAGTAGAVDAATMAATTFAAAARAARDACFSAYADNLAAAGALAGADVVDAHAAVHGVADFYASGAADASAIDGGVRPTDLAELWLWFGGRGEWVPDSWFRFRNQLLSLNEGWEVWTSWYEARFEGAPANEKLEVARVLVVDEVWNQGPKAVNAEIMRVVGQHQVAGGGPRRGKISEPISNSAEMQKADLKGEKYHSIFISHTSTDKPFVRRLRDDLQRHGVPRVWVDEAEIEIGDSLIAKIEQGMKETRYVGVVLSTRSIKAPWVKKELDIAMSREITDGEVTVLPLLYEKCEVPFFLRDKLYADFTEPETYEEVLAKLLRRLRVR